MSGNISFLLFPEDFLDFFLASGHDAVYRDIGLFSHVFHFGFEGLSLSV
jgi:hypothetical protein